MTKKKKESSIRSFLGGFTLWTLIGFGVCFFIYQQVIKPAQEAENSLGNALPPLIFTLSRTDELCSALKDPALSSFQKEGIINNLIEANQGMADIQAKFELSIIEAGRALDKEILKLQALGLRIPEQYASIIAIKDSCPPNILMKDKLEQLQKDILNRYPRTWLGLLLYKVGLYKVGNLDLDKYL